MQQQLSWQNLAGMGFMAFAMFLGAGNLIFPPYVGYQAGTALWSAAAGFLITGVGLPLLGIVSIAQVGGGFNAITRELPRGLIILMGSCIFLIIGPLYAVPRTAMVAYEIGIVPFLHDSTGDTVRLIFCTIFFSSAWYLCLNPGRLLESVGKLITPALVILLLILGLSPFFHPQGHPGMPIEQYAHTPFVSGFTVGYLTMDALAALMFGVVITNNLKSHGITHKKPLIRYTILTGIIAASGMALVYISLFYLGATTRELVPSATNGGDILALYVNSLFGSSGSVFLSIVVMLACLTTAIGCITAASEYFAETIPFFSYKWLTAIISISCIFIANLGLNEIISLFIPVLFLLYPICIALILLGLIRPIIPKPVFTYRATLMTVLLFSLIDAGKDLSLGFINTVLKSLSFLPGFNVHMSWLLPSIIVFVLSMIIGKCMTCSVNNKYPEKLS